MAILVYTRNPAGLLQQIKHDINQRKIVTWSCDTDGDFTHNVDQWRNKAWFRPTVHSDHLRLRIVPIQNQLVMRVVYGVYHGRFVETVITHYSTLITKVDPTVNPANDEPQVV